MINAIPLFDNHLDTKIGSALWDAIGNTPLIKLEKLTRELTNDVEMFAKAEWQNPGGSVKDRAAFETLMLPLPTILYWNQRPLR